MPVLPVTVTEVEYRYNALIFWLYSSPELLNPRLDKRVDEMIAVYSIRQNLRKVVNVLS